MSISNRKKVKNRYRINITVSLSLSSIIIESNQYTLNEDK